MHKRNYLTTLLLSLLFIILFRIITPFDGLSSSGMALIGIFIGILILWMKVSIDWPSLLLLMLLGSLDELSFSSVLASSFGSGTITFLIFTFVLTYALSRTPYLKKTAKAFISSRIATKGPWAFVILYCASILFIGMFVSPTVLFFLYLPILEEIYKVVDLKKGDKTAAMFMMLTVIMTGISSGMTPIAHAFPLIALQNYSKVTGNIISYASYMAIGIPTGLLSAIVILLSFALIYHPDMTSLSSFDALKLNLKEKEANRSDKIILALFIMVIFLWVSPSLVTSITKEGFIYQAFKYLNSLGNTFPPLLATTMLCMIRIDDKPLLTLQEAFTKGVSWPSIIMCIGTSALGSALVNESIGLNAYLSARLAPITTSLSPMMIVLFFILWAALQTNLSSNMVTATLVSTAALSISFDNINLASLIVLIGMMSSYSFATPPAMPCVAIAGSSGYTNPKQMAIWGFIAMFISWLIFSFIAYPLGILIL